MLIELLQANNPLQQTRTAWIVLEIGDTLQLLAGCCIWLSILALRFLMMCFNALISLATQTCLMQMLSRESVTISREPE